MAEESAWRTSLIRLAISVEGQTEEEFVKSVLAPHLQQALVTPTAIRLGRARSGMGGGNVSIERLALDMARLYPNFDAVTSLVDFYGFRGKGDRTVEELEEHLAQEIQKKVSSGWDQRKVIPYVQKHEFEGLLFSDVSAFSVMPVATGPLVEELGEVRSRFPNPEDINDNADTAPSKRIKSIVPGYQKVVDGTLIARETGLDTIRAACPRFAEWLAKLESLGGPLKSA